jgi:hypothetical protein
MGDMNQHHFADAHVPVVDSPEDAWRSYFARMVGSSSEIQSLVAVLLVAARLLFVSEVNRLDRMQAMLAYRIFRSVVLWSWTHRRATLAVRGLLGLKVAASDESKY